MASNAQELNQNKPDFKKKRFKIYQSDKGGLTTEEQITLLAEIIADLLFNEIQEYHDQQFIT